ncbi:OLC1v1002194C1 [Oldenlandia corymbosa var. corymbosa]|uniref:OLC1v1002194C1 n=1 Tax=Oldenlandia corymbosa var. corymbosa TaxID=529605 RepID=A0AAV1D7T0_OLDCO|nr:OLC1v1002194C1 [Oldenlandia corymbosa var. corymbosa]
MRIAEQEHSAIFFPSPPTPPIQNFQKCYLLTLKDGGEMPQLHSRVASILHRPRTHHHHLLRLVPIFNASKTTAFLPQRIARVTMSSTSTPYQDSIYQKEEKDEESIAQALKYHNQTKHNFTNYARGPRGLDWANQPNPFRRYVSAPLLQLLHPNSENFDVPPLYHEVFNSLPSPKPISKSTISQLFYYSLALSAWKSTGFSTWSLRVNPSSGNLHPTEAYIVAPPIDSLIDHPFVGHYAPKEHGLEIRAQIPSGFFGEVLPRNSFLIGLSSIFWREAWKYGERAFRYCNHDVGHAIGAVSMAAAGLGWEVKILDGLGYGELEKLMGLHVFPEFRIPSRPVKGEMPEIEFEHPDCVLLVYPSGMVDFEVDYKELSSAISEFLKLEWKGKPNLLSKEHVCWDIIYRTAEAAIKPLKMLKESIAHPYQSSELINENSYKGLTLWEVVRKRRSAVDMDGTTTMARETFFQILLHCMPTAVKRGGKQSKQVTLPFRALSWDAEVHAVLFVHRVLGLPKGLYFLARNEEHLDELRKSTRPEFTWVKPDGCPNDLPLYELAKGDFKELSKRLSCHQDIAGDGCFSLGMVAHFQPTLNDKGAWMYPRLFWETGVLGQVLYLEAHAVGISATGIGCFFDDPVHEVLGLRGTKFQSLYHFTVGGPVIDKRIMSLPAYPGPSIDA